MEPCVARGRLVAKFVYAVGVDRRYAKARQQQQLSLSVADVKPDLDAMGLEIRAWSGQGVQRPTCLIDTLSP